MLVALTASLTSVKCYSVTCLCSLAATHSDSLTYSGQGCGGSEDRPSLTTRVDPPHPRNVSAVRWPYTPSGMACPLACVQQRYRPNFTAIIIIVVVVTVVVIVVGVTLITRFITTVPQRNVRHRPTLRLCTVDLRPSVTVPRVLCRWERRDASNCCSHWTRLLHSLAQRRQGKWFGCLFVVVIRLHVLFVFVWLVVWSVGWFFFLFSLLSIGGISKMP